MPHETTENYSAAGTEGQDSCPDVEIWSNSVQISLFKSIFPLPAGILIEERGRKAGRISPRQEESPFLQREKAHSGHAASPQTSKEWLFHWPVANRAL